MARVKSIGFHRVLNSHVEFTNEFVIEFADGARGTGASPQGETISIYEDGAVSVSPETITRQVEGAGVTGTDLDQTAFDEILRGQIPQIGRNNAFGLSLAFFNASRQTHSAWELFGQPHGNLPKPRLCLNILNGGRHAYTNPVLSDFPEFILVARSPRLEDVIRDHQEVQRAVRSGLLGKEKVVVSGNPVNRFATADNRECMDFLTGIRDRLGLSDSYDLMIDASAGDLWTEGSYRLALTDGSSRSGDEFCEYWLDMIHAYDLRFLEDPFREQDPNVWGQLTGSAGPCSTIGDNLYSSDAERIEAGAARRLTHGAVIKPNQAGSVTAVRRAVEACRRTAQIPIASHRSISTEETFVSTLTCLSGVPFIKIGPLLTDYSSVMRLNEIIRLAE